jgi:hypothetical protein
MDRRWDLSMEFLLSRRLEMLTNEFTASRWTVLHGRVCSSQTSLASVCHIALQVIAMIAWTAQADVMTCQHMVLAILIASCSAGLHLSHEELSSLIALRR